MKKVLVSNIAKKMTEKISPILILILQTKSIADTIGSDTNTVILTTMPVYFTVVSVFLAQFSQSRVSIYRKP